MECAKAPSSSGVRKVKKKQVKDEMDRLKQAEKKKRRLEKALATSAAIRSELEKKKQKKKEEQQRLDEEGAAIAEAVALQVLLGEDSDGEDSCHIVVNKKDDEEFNPWNCCAGSFDLFMAGRRQNAIPCHSISGSPTEENVWVHAHQSGYVHNNGWTVSSGPLNGGDFHGPYFNEGGWEATEISAGLIAAQAVKSLQIAEDEHVDSFVFNQMVRG